MIETIQYSVTFPTNQLALKGDLSLEPGITAITGDNGSGKTFGSIEMIRYLLFGKKALRGPACDYKTLDASMRFLISGMAYVVTRNRKSESLVDENGETLAVGAEAVSQKIIQLLGFGLEVFDVVCAAKQKETDKLSSMGSAARKRLIDQVIGLSSNEVVEKACREEANGLRREAGALTRNLRPIDEPVMPEGYRPAAEIRADLDALNADQRRRRELQTIIDKGSAAAPALVNAPARDLAELEEHERHRASVLAQVAAAQRELDRLPVPVHSAVELDTAEQILAYETEIARRGERPTMSIEDAEAAIETWDHRAILAKIGDTEIDCPACSHTFSPGAELPAAPLITKTAAQEQLRRHDRWSQPLPDCPKGITDLTPAEIRAGRDALKQAERRPTLEEAVAAEIPVDRSDVLAQTRQEVASWNAYQTALRKWKTDHGMAVGAMLELEEMGEPIDGDPDNLNAEFVAARIYESALETYAKAKVAYDETEAAIAEKLQLSAEFKRGAEALLNTRSAVKQFLSPALSRVSSSLIHRMTGGVLTHMIVDEDMNVTVDGQDISTLSGAGSTVANLALRLALGRVLVREVFPVFIADEADADMSPSRAQFTAECLAELRDQLKQILIITHKEVSVADHVITR